MKGVELHPLVGVRPLQPRISPSKNRCNYAENRYIFFTKLQPAKPDYKGEITEAWRSRYQVIGQNTRVRE